MTHAAKPGLPQFGFATICRSKSEKIVIAVRCRSCNALKNPPHDFVESIRIDVRANVTTLQRHKNSSDELLSEFENQR